MKVSTSILSIKSNLSDNIKILDKSGTDYIHLDIMDGNFVTNKTWDYSDIKDILKDISTPVDVHLMVSNLDYYIDNFSKLNPNNITFHLEATDNINKYINLVKEKNIKVGLAIKPNTDINLIIPYLEYLDLVLVMSVEPGTGGQKFIDSSCDRIKLLKEIKELYGYNYIIEVDGGINADTVKLVAASGVDLVVSGSYITNSDNYKERIDTLKLK